MIVKLKNAKNADWKIIYQRIGPGKFDYSVYHAEYEGMFWGNRWDYVKSFTSLEAAENYIEESKEFPKYYK